MIAVTGTILKEALENGVSGWPRYDGKWPCVSGVTFSFNPSKPEGHKVDPDSIIMVKTNEKLDL